MTQKPKTTLATPKKAFLLAAGRGLRMRHLTDNCPKPLVPVDGVALLDRAIDALVAAGVQEVVINLHYLGHMIEDHLKGRKDIAITFSHEKDLLDTGGGVKACLSFFGDAPFYVLNADVFWTEKGAPALQRLAEAWQEEKMDALLLLYPRERCIDFEGAGDYSMDSEGKITRRRDNPSAPFVFTGPRIVSAKLFDDSPNGAFSFLELFDRAESAGRLHGLVHQGAWYHVGTPEALALTEKALAAARKDKTAAQAAR